VRVLVPYKSLVKIVVNRCYKYDCPQKGQMKTALMKIYQNHQHVIIKL